MAGSHSPKDLVCCRSGNATLYVQVKGNRSGGPYKDFGPADRKALSAVAKRAGATALLVWRNPENNALRFIEERDWPQ